MFKIKRIIKVADKKKPIEIIPFGDLHNGSPNCSFNKFVELIDYVAKQKQTYVIGMGDYLDCIMTHDKRFDFNHSPQTLDQVRKEVLGELKRIKGKILCLFTGNHEYKLAQWGYGDPTQYFAQELSVPYAGYSGFIRISTERDSFHKKGIVIYAHHGWSAGRTTGSTVTNVERLAQHWDADVYLVGHSHKLWCTRQVRIGWAGERKVIFGNTGTFLQTCTDGTSGYSERAGYPPLKLGVLKIKWYWNTGDLHITE